MGLFGSEMPIPLYIVLAIFAVIFACVVAAIAQRKGYSYWGFWLFGFFFFLPALVVVLLIGYKNAKLIDPAEELSKFKDLLDRGAITQEEYNRQKKALLS